MKSLNSDGTENGGQNVAIGQYALRDVTTGFNMVAIGESALRVNTTGAYNTAVGQESLVNNTTGSNNVAFGKTAGENNTEGGSNTYIGISAGDLITTGSYNTIIGKSADPSANNASNQIVIGYNATGQADNSVTLGNADVTAIYMAQDSGATVYAGGLNIGGTAITANAAELNYLDGVTSSIQTQLNSAGGASNVTGLSDALTEDNSIYIGNDPSSTTDSAEYNVAFGTTALDAVTTGDQNTASGYNALSTNTTGSYNTASGLEALYSNITGDNNTASGKATLKFNTSGDNNTASGTNALYTNTTGGYNTASGRQALYENTTGGFNTASGSFALQKNTTGDYNTAFGYKAGDVITTGSNNTIIGRSADSSGATATNQTVIGKEATGQADNSVTLGNADVTAIYMAQDSGATVYAAGLNTGGTAITSNQVLFEGATDDAYEVILTVTDPTADRTITFPDKTGTVAMTSDITGASNLNGLTDVKTENSSFFIGNIPASTNNAYYNNSLGANALDAITTGDYNTAIGQEALETVSSGHKNTSVGAQSLRYVNTGDQNTSIGVYAGDFITTGSNNVIIGYEADPSANSASNQIVIGKGATGQGDNYAVIGNADVTRVYAAQDAGATLYAAGLNIGGSAVSLNNLSDVLVGNSSFFFGSDQSNASGAYYSIGIGDNSLNSVTSGDYNVGIGQESLENLTSGHRNTALGAQSLRYVTGGQNTGLGAYAGDVITTGSNNVIMGYNADPSGSGADNQIVIGKGATGQGDNYAVIGNADVTRVYAAEDGAAVLYASATIQPSDLRFKSLIQPVNLGLQFINKLNPVSYFKMSKSQYKGEEKNSETRYEYGLIAQEVDNILKESDPENSIISKDEEGFLGMDYKQLIMPLIKSVQELSEEVDRLKNEIKELKK